MRTLAILSSHFQNKYTVRVTFQERAGDLKGALRKTVLVNVFKKNSEGESSISV